MTSAPQPDPGSQSVAELVAQASRQTSELVRQELRLAVAELTEKGKHAGVGVGLFGTAGLLAFFGGGATIAAVIAALALALPVWASALIVGAALFAAAGALALAGRGQTAKALPPVPEQAVESTKDDVAEIKERAHR
jgi:hypothetical protein